MKVQRVVPDRMAERKYVDTILAMTVTGSTTGVLLNGVAEGSDNTNRIGRKTLIKSVSIKGQFAISQTDLGSVAFPENGDTVKVAIVLDTQPNGALAAITDVWTTGGPFAHRNLDNIERFQVLQEDIYSVGLTGPNAVAHQRYSKVDIPVRYTGTAAAIANITTGSLIMFVLDNNGSGANQGIFNGITRVVFTDE